MQFSEMFFHKKSASKSKLEQIRQILQGGVQGGVEGGLIRTWHRYGNPIATPCSARSFGNRILQNFQIGNAISNRGLERKCERDPFLLLSWSRSGEKA